MPKGFRGISLPSDLVDEIERLIKENPQLGYRSLADFIIDAVRAKIRDLGLELPAYSIVERSMNGITIWDGREKKFIKIIIDENGYKCTYCDSRRCEHIRHMERTEGKGHVLL
ncbi:MAG: ribbon-helix-helix domain-containing protein [Candidatus Bathyarchaeia archaeon]